MAIPDWVQDNSAAPAPTQAAQPVTKDSVPDWAAEEKPKTPSEHTFGNVSWNGLSAKYDIPVNASDEQIRQASYDALVKTHPKAKIPPPSEFQIKRPNDVSLVDAASEPAKDTASHITNGFFSLPDLVSEGMGAATNALANVGAFIATGGGANKEQNAVDTAKALQEWGAKQQANSPTVREMNERINPGNSERGSVFLGEMLGGTLLPFGPKGKAALPAAAQAEIKGLTQVGAKQAGAKDVVSKLTDALTNAGTARAEQTALYKAERAKRFAKVAQGQEELGGRAAYEKGLKAMKGELPKADFESVIGQFSPKEVDQLFDSISLSELSSGSKFAAHNGLEALLNGNLPQPKQLEYLAEVFPPGFIKATLSNRSGIKKAGGIVGNLWNSPKSLQSTADLSGPMRQGLGLIHRPEYWKSLAPMLKAAVNPKTSDDLAKAIETHPNYDIAREAGLSITTSGKLGLNEDMFRPHLAENIPVWGHVVAGSERAYVGFLNKLRFDTFNTLLKQAARAGNDMTDPAVSSGIARYINVMTGRGGLGSLGPASSALNNVLYSPGLISSRLQILAAPVQSIAGKGFIADLPKGLKLEAAKSYSAIIAANTTALSLAVMAGKTVNLNPTSSDFLKMKDGDTRLDFGGGLTQYVTLGARAFSREKTASGENGSTREMNRKGDTPLDNDVTFVMNKMHPSLTLFLDQQRGKTSVGEPFEWQTAIINRLAPMGFPDIAATLEEHGSNPGVFYGFLGLLGAGLQNYHSKTDAPKIPEGEKAVETADAPDWANAPAETPTTTSTNAGASDILEGLGLSITDNGLRSQEDQERYYAMTKGVAKPGTSPHEDGNAVDVRPSEDTTPEEIISEMEAKGYKGVKVITRDHGTGPHWHIQWEGYE